MAHKAFVEFYETYLRGPKGADIVSKLEAVTSDDQYYAVAVEAGRAAGFSFTADEVRDVMKASAAKRDQGSGELSEDQLETAVGGAGLMATAPTVNLGTALNIRNVGGAQLPDAGLTQQNTAMCRW